MFVEDCTCGAKPAQSAASIPRNGDDTERCGRVVVRTACGAVFTGIDRVAAKICFYLAAKAIMCSVWFWVVFPRKLGDTSSIGRRSILPKCENAAYILEG